MKLNFGGISALYYFYKEIGLSCLFTNGAVLRRRRQKRWRGRGEEKEEEEEAQGEEGKREGWCKS